MTDLFASRISECELIKLHGKWLIIFPKGTSRIVDRGFAFCTDFYPNLNIAFVPAFMRGRTLSDAFVILDEAQNTTPMQMKMFLTRLGENASMVVTGDLTQVDLPSGQRSGLFDAVNILDGTDGVGFIRFDEVDVVRHPLVAKIINAYAKKSSGKSNVSR